MDTITDVFMRFFGPILLVIGFSLLLHRKRYKKMMKDLREFTLAYYLAGVLPLCMGMLLVMFHNLWGTVEEVLVSLIGWSAIAKGIVRLLMPDFVKSMTDKIGLPFISAVAVLVIAWGGYMTWVGYELQALMA